jgi:hypothetical protein
MDIGVKILLALAKAVPAVAEVIGRIAGGLTPEEVLARLELARAAVEDPIDTSASDAARRDEMERILRGADIDERL